MAEVLGIAASVIAVVDMSTKVLNLCFQYAQEVKNAEDDIERLRKELMDIRTTAGQVQILLNGPRGSALQASRQLDLAIKDACSTLESLVQEFEPSTVRKAMGRITLRALKWPFKNKSIEGTLQHLARRRDTILLAMNIDQTTRILSIDYSIVIDKLPTAKGASFDSYAEEYNPTCLPNTRVELLKDIARWIEQPDSRTLFWLNGMAGTGKSTISRTVACSRSDHGDLGACFFFKRGEADRGNLAKFMPTLAHQLASRMPGIAPLIKNAIDADPAIVRKTVKEQFEKLIQGPLSEALGTTARLPRLVIVIDALDECELDDDIRLLINLLSNTTSLGSHFRVFLTSRPELPIRLGFSEVTETYQDLILHELPTHIIEHDIYVFLAGEFNKIRKSFNATVGDNRKLATDWPGLEELQNITKMAVPLFIFAATLVRFVNDRKCGSPLAQLDKVLGHRSRSHGSQLDLTYGPVLNSQLHDQLSKGDREQIINDFVLIVGTIVTLANPLAVSSLSRLLDVPRDMVDTRLDMLHSVMSVPLDDSPKETNAFWVDERLMHRNVATNCLRVMKGGLRENICNMSFPGMRRSAVDAKRIAEALPPELQYACRYWAHHLVASDFEDHDGLVNESWDACLAVLEGHTDRVSSVVFSSDSKTLASASGDDTVRVWDAETGVCKGVLEGHTDWVNSVVFSSDSKTLASASRDKTVRVWDAETGACKGVLEGHTHWVNSLVFSSDSKTLASASRDKTVRVWDAETGACKGVLEGHTVWVNSVVFSSDSKTLASASGDDTVRVWDAETGACKGVLEGHTGRVNSVVFSSDSKTLASASIDYTVRVWDAETGVCKGVLKGHTNGVNSVVFSSDSKTLASASSDDTVRVWDAEMGACKGVLEGHTHWVNSVVFSSDSKTLASASVDYTVRVWDVETGVCKGVLEGHTDGVNSVVFSSDSKTLASASYDKTVRAWDAETGACKGVLEGHTGRVNSLVFSSDSKTLASGSRDYTVRVWDAETGACKGVLEGHTHWVNSVVFSSDSKTLASASYDMTVRVWDVETGVCKGVLEGHTLWVNSVVFSSDSKTLASASSDDTVRVWDAEMGACKGVLEGHTDWVNSVVFSSDSKTLASASYDKTVRVWDAEMGACKGVLEGHTDRVNSVVFSSDSKTLASASRDYTVRVWDAETGVCKGVLEGHTDGVISVAFSSDSKTLASGSRDKTVRVWDVQTGACKQVIQAKSVPHTLSFTSDASRLVTSIGAFPVLRERCAQPISSTYYSPACTLGLRNNSWVTLGGEDWLWLPAECRGGISASSATTVAIGCRSGRVIILGLSLPGTR
ncbi:hypothetical protein ACHAQH_010064 [Verticillium albo-atrum]